MYWHHPEKLLQVLLSSEEYISKMKFDAVQVEQGSHPNNFCSWKPFCDSVKRYFLIFKPRLNIKSNVTDSSKKQLTLALVSFVDGFLRDTTRKHCSNGYHMSLLNLDSEVMF